MVDAGEKDGNREPSERGTHPNNADDQNRIQNAGGRLRWWIVWPWHWWRSGDHQRRTANATTLLAVGTLVLAGVNVGMLLEMRHAARDTKRAIGATNRLATAAENSAKIARDTEIRQLRAYLDIGSAALPPTLVKDQPAKVYFEIVNTGRTPAYKVTPVPHAEIRLYPPPRLTIYSVTRPAGLVEKVINPNRTQKIEATTVNALSQEQVNEIIDGSKFRLYVWGTVYFIDAFGKERHTNFCEIMGGREMKSDVECAHRGAD